jgi:hypothetical protein
MTNSTIEIETTIMLNFLLRQIKTFRKAVLKYNQNTNERILADINTLEQEFLAKRDSDDICVNSIACKVSATLLNIAHAICFGYHTHILDYSSKDLTFFASIIVIKENIEDSIKNFNILTTKNSNIKKAETVAHYRITSSNE